MSTLLLVGSLMLTLTLPLAPSAPAVDAGAPTSADIVPRFYAELNAELAGAPPSQAPSVLSPALVVTESGAADRSFVAWLRQLRSAHPLATTLHLAPTGATIHDDRIAVTVHLRRSPTAVADPNEPPVSLPASTLDQLTLAHGQVVAYTPGPALAALPWTRSPVPLGPVEQPTMTVLLRLALAPDAGLANLAAPGPELLFVEQGELEVAWTGGGQLLRTAAVAWRPLSVTTHALTLASGDALLLPAAARHALRAAAMPVDLLTLAAFPADRLSPMAVAPHVGSAVQSVIDLADLFAVGLPRQAVAGVTATALATAMDGLTGDGCPRVLTIHQATLAPGEAITAHRVDGVELAAMESGWLTIGADDDLPLLGATAADLGRSTGNAPQLRNTGVGPLPLVAFTVTPQRAGPCPRSAQPGTPAPTIAPLGVHQWRPAAAS